ncbi:hypothetical protein S83_021267, partial [Arachis hypogaea]
TPELHILRVPERSITSQFKNTRATYHLFSSGALIQINLIEMNSMETIVIKNQQQSFVLLDDISA